MKKHTTFALGLLLLTGTLSAQVLTPYSIQSNGHYVWGYKDAAGKVVVEPKYSQSPFLYEGYARVEMGAKKGLINSKGKEITPIKYDDVDGSRHNGLFKVRMAGKYGYVDTTGTEVIPLLYKEASNFNSGRAIVNLEAGPLLIDTKGKTVTSLAIYDQTHELFSEGLCGVMKAAKWGFIDPNGKPVIPLQYDNVNPVSEGYSVVVFGGKPGEYGTVKGGKWGFIDKAGKELTPIKYQYAGSFSEGVAVVNTGGVIDVYQAGSGGKWGFINKAGKEITPLKYDYAEGSSEGLSRVNVGGKWASDGMGSNVIKGGKWGYVNNKGIEIIPLQYEAAEGFFLGKATVIKDGKSIEIDKKGVAKVVPVSTVVEGDLEDDEDDDQ